MNLSKKTFIVSMSLMFVFSLLFFGLFRFYISFYPEVMSTGPVKNPMPITVAALISTAVFGATLWVYLFFIRKSIIGRIENLTKRALEIDKTSDFSFRLPVRADDEISDLAWSINTLLDRVTESNYSLEKNIEESSSMLERSIKERISELMTMNQVLTLMEEVFEHSLEGIVITDSDSIIIKVNPAFTNITGYTEQEVLGKNPSILKSDHHNPHFYQSMWESIQTDGRWAGEIWNRHKDGNAFPEWLSISAIRNSEGQTSHYVGVFHDISDMKRQEELLRYHALHDSMTGLPNMFLLKNRIEQSILHSKRDKNRFGVVFLDLDNFKKINESLGLAIGDILLKDAATRLRSIARNVDTVARHGGDEFIVLVESIEDEKPVIVLAQRILMAFKEPFKILESTFHIGISMGIAIFPEDGEDSDTLLRNADTAMYRAKDVGKETFAMYTISLNETAERNILMETEIRKALSDKNFEVHYQPQMDLRTGKIVGVEGLARLNIINGPAMAPDEFIPFSEEAGLIFEIDRVIMEKALVEIGSLINNGSCPLKLALNCSAKLLHLKRLPNIITGYLAKFNFNPEWFELEITESSIMQNYRESLDVIHRVKETGISISLDDFGTGYSSLAQLKNLPIDTIKIDRSFVEEIETNVSNAHIIEAVVTLSRKFGIKVVAEGVETEEQLSFVRAAGCDIVQGYFISRPLRFENLRNYLGLGPV